MMLVEKVVCMVVVFRSYCVVASLLLAVGLAVDLQNCDLGACQVEMLVPV